MSSYLETLLLGICEKLQLSPSQYDMAVDRYETISEIIQDDDVFNNVDLKIYSHGSFRLKTTVKPYNENEFDLDFVSELPFDSNMSPKELYDHILRILSNDGIHNNMVEPKSRCIRINYANDFHLDIMPGKCINMNTNEIIVPDKELKGWYHHSNPKGFANWFEMKARQQILMERRWIQASFDVEDITEQELATRLEPMRRAVQLVKRYRDVYCDANNKEPVRSIVICTLMGNTPKFSGDTISIIHSFCDYVNSLIELSNGQPFAVKNPVVDEILTEKWAEGKNYQDFVDTIKSLTSDVDELLKYSINSDINKLVKKMFGESVTDRVIKENAQLISNARTQGSLSVNSKGTIVKDGPGMPIKKNTFFGDQ